MSVWTSWAIVGSKTTPELHDYIMAIVGMTEGQDLPIFDGSLDEFSNEFRNPFTVYYDGRYIKVGVPS